VVHQWDDGTLILELRWKTNESSFVPFNVAKVDHPHDVATYILRNKVGLGDGRYQTGRYTRWTRSLNRNINKVIRSMFCLNGICTFSVIDTQPNITLPHDLRQLYPAARRT
jgi:hypothetical protein